MGGIKWEKLSPRQFEEFTQVLVEAMGYTGVTYWGGPGDEGHDIVAYQPATQPGIQPSSRMFVFQCKRCKKLTTSEIAKELLKLGPKKIDTWVLVTTYSPSPALRRWVDSLSKSSLQYHFFIEAWWRENLERFVRDYASYLLKNLPLDIVNTLDLRHELQLTSLTGTATVVARLRDQANSQVERFAKGKYIPQLYIRRKLQETLDHFHASEAELAKSLKNTTIQSIKGEISQANNI